MPIPQNLSTTVENPSGKGFPAVGRGPVSRSGGKAGWTIARGFSTPHAGGVVLTFFLLSRGLASVDARSVYSRVDRPSPVHPTRTRNLHDGQGQADVPTEQPPPREGARLPAPDADQGRSRDPRRSTA